MFLVRVQFAEICGKGVAFARADTDCCNVPIEWWIWFIDSNMLDPLTEKGLVNLEEAVLRGAAKNRDSVLLLDWFGEEGRLRGGMSNLSESGPEWEIATNDDVVDSIQT